MKTVSIVIPAMNEENTLGNLLEDFTKVRPELEKNYNVELIVVDDHSTDKTVEIAKSYNAAVCHNKGLNGKGSTLRVGFDAAEGDYLIMLDADYSHRVEDIPQFLAELDKGAGLVIGSRIIGGSDEYTRIRAFGNIFLTFMVGFFLKRYLSDALNGFKAFRAEVYKDFKYDSRHFEIEIEIIANTLRKNLPVVEIRSHERERAGGVAKSKVIKHGTKFLMRVFKEYLRNKMKINVEKSAK